MGRFRLVRTGTEPVTAYSDLRLRLLLSLVFTPLFVLGTVLLALWWVNAEPGDDFGPTAVGMATLVCAAAAVVAAIDLVVVLRRLRRARERGLPSHPAAPENARTARFRD